MPRWKIRKASFLIIIIVIGVTSVLLIIVDAVLFLYGVIYKTNMMLFNISVDVVHLVEGYYVCIICTIVSLCSGEIGLPQNGPYGGIQKSP